jgi:hypothetical protein
MALAVGQQCLLEACKLLAWYIVAYRTSKQIPPIMYSPGAQDITMKAYHGRKYCILHVSQLPNQSSLLATYLPVLLCASCSLSSNPQTLCSPSTVLQLVFTGPKQLVRQSRGLTWRPPTTVCLEPCPLHEPSEGARLSASEPLWTTLQGTYESQPNCSCFPFPLPARTKIQCSLQTAKVSERWLSLCIGTWHQGVQLTSANNTSSC